MLAEHAVIEKLWCLQAPTKRRGRLPKAALATASAAEASTGNSAPAPSAPAAEKPARKRGRPSKAGEHTCLPIALRRPGFWLHIGSTMQYLVDV